MINDDVRQSLLEIEELKLKAQLRAVREAIRGEKQPEPEDGNKRISQIEYVYRILKAEKRPLHVSEIIEKCRNKFNIELYRESIVSALIKKVNRMDRFIKTGPNAFGLYEHRELYRSQSKEG